MVGILISILFIVGCSLKSNDNTLDKLTTSAIGNASVGGGTGALVGNQLGLTGEGALVGGAAGLFTGLGLGAQLESLDARISSAEQTLARIQDEQRIIRNRIKEVWYESDSDLIKRGVTNLTLQLKNLELSANEREALRLFSWIYRNLSMPSKITISIAEPKSDKLIEQKDKFKIDKILISELKNNGIDETSLEIDKKVDPLIESPTVTFTINGFFPHQSVDGN